MRSMRTRALLWLLLAVALLVVCIRQFSGRSPLQADLLALLPATERSSVAEDAISHLTQAVGNRLFFLLGLSGEGAEKAKTTKEAAKFFAKHLEASGALRQVVAEIPPVDIKQWLGFYQPFRFHLLSDEDFEALGEGQASLELRLWQKLYSPFRFGPSLPLAVDPFGLTDNWLASLPFKNLKLQPEDGFLVAREKDTLWVAVSAVLPDSAYGHETPSRVARAIREAEHALSQQFPDVELLRTGTLFYADAARTGAERDLRLIALGSLLGLSLLMYWVFRSIRSLALGLLSVGFGILAALVLTTAVYGEVHLITLVFGASLIGEAIDYAIQYFAAHMGAGPSWEPMAGLKKVAPALNLALAAGLLCYGALIFAPFLALSQVALFTLTGLSCAWLTVFLLLPWLLQKPSCQNPETVARMPRKLLGLWQKNIGRKAGLAIVLVAVALSLPGWLRLSGSDDIRLLISRPEVLVGQEERIRALTGMGNDSQFYLVEGATPEVVLAREEKLAKALKPQLEAGAASGFQSLSVFVPSAARQKENRRLWQEAVFGDLRALSQLLADLREGAQEALWKEFQEAENQWMTLEKWMEQPVSAPFRHLWLGKVEGGHFASVVLLQGVKQYAALEAVATPLEGVTFVDKPGSISRLFRDYRHWGSGWFLVALCLVYSALCLRYGLRQALFVLTPTMLASALTLGLLGLASVALTLFHVMGLMLALGVGVNYSIFLREGGVHSGAPLAGVLLSAGTTLLSFGLLAFSSMPALSGFGLTLLLGVSLSVFFSPLVLTFEDRRQIS